MRKFGLIVPVVAFLSAVSLQVGATANAQTQTQPPYAGVTSVNPLPERTVELRLLSLDGKLIAHWFADIEKGQELTFANFARIGSIRKTSDGVLIYHHEGKGSVKTMRNGMANTLLQTNSDAVIVECVEARTPPSHHCSPCRHPRCPNNPLQESLFLKNRLLF